MGALPPPPFLTAEGERKPGKCASTGRVYIYPMLSSTLTSTISALLCVSEMLHDSKQPLSQFLLLVIDFYAFSFLCFFGNPDRAECKELLELFFSCFSSICQIGLLNICYGFIHVKSLCFFLLLFVFCCQDYKESCGAELTEVRDSMLSSTPSVSLLSFRLDQFEICKINLRLRKKELAL